LQLDVGDGATVVLTCELLLLRFGSPMLVELMSAMLVNGPSPIGRVTVMVITAVSAVSTGATVA
jgi:hypothetical protein